MDASRVSSVAEKNYASTEKGLRLRFLVTLDCNFKCVCCHQEGFYKRNSKLLSSETIISIFSTIKKNINPTSAYVGLTGGNPTLREDIVSIVAGLKSAGADVVAITDNGSMLERRIMELESAGLDTLHISFHSAINSTFYKITGQKAVSIDRIYYSICKAMEVLGSDKVRLNVTLFRDLNTTSQEIRAFVDVVRSLGIEKVKIGSLIPEKPGVVNDTFLKYFITVDDYVAKFIRTVGGVDNKRESNSSAISFDFCGTTFDCLKPSLKQFCYGCRLEEFCQNYGEYCNDIRITTDGNIKPCLFLTKGSVLECPDLLKRERIIQFL